MKMSDLTFERIENYDPFNRRSKPNGMVSNGLPATNGEMQ